jgi:hypothetical protein
MLLNTSTFAALWIGSISGTHEPSIVELRGATIRPASRHTKQKSSAAIVLSFQTLGATPQQAGLRRFVRYGLN